MTEVSSQPSGDTIERLTSILKEVNSSAKYPKGYLATCCESELQELMKQIDVMIHNQRMEWERKMQSMQSKVERKDQENLLIRATLEQKNLEVQKFRQEVQALQRNTGDVAKQYEQELNQVRQELQKYKRDYARLHRRRQEKPEPPKNDGLTAQLERVSRELQECQEQVEKYRQMGTGWEREKQEMETKSRMLEGKCGILAKKCDELEEERSDMRRQLEKTRTAFSSSEIAMKSQVALAEGRLTSANEELQRKSDEIHRLEAVLRDTADKHGRERADTKRELKVLESAIQSASSDLEAARKQCQSKETQVLELQRTARTQEQRIFELEKHIAAKDSMIRALTEADSRRDDQMQTLNNSLNSLRAELVAATENESRLERLVAEFQSKLAAEGQRSTQRKWLDSSKQDKITETERNLEVCRRELEALRLENNFLRQTVLLQSTSSGDGTTQVDGLRKANARLEDENRALVDRMGQVEKQFTLKFDKNNNEMSEEATSRQRDRPPSRGHAPGSPRSPARCRKDERPESRMSISSEFVFDEDNRRHDISQLLAARIKEMENGIYQ